MMMESWWCLKGLKDKHVGIPAYKSSATVPWSQSVHPSIASSIASPWNTSPLHPIEIHHQMHLLQIHYQYKCTALKCIANTNYPKWNTLRSIQQHQLNMTNEKCQGGKGWGFKDASFSKLFSEDLYFLADKVLSHTLMEFDGLEVFTISHQGTKSNGWIRA